MTTNEKKHREYLAPDASLIKGKTRARSGLGEAAVGTARIEVERYYDGGKSPEGDGELVGVEEVVEHAVDIVGEQAEGEGEGHIGYAPVAGATVDADAAGKGDEEDA